MFKLNNPKSARHKAARLAAYRDRLHRACATGNVVLEAAEVERMIDAAWQLECGAPPGLQVIAKAADRILSNRTIDDAKAIASALKMLNAAIEKSAPVTQYDLCAELAAKGLNWDTLAANLTTVNDVVTAMAKDHPIVSRPGKTPTPRKEWAVQLATELKPKGIPNRAISRILATLFDGTDAGQDAMNQMIRDV